MLQRLRVLTYTSCPEDVYARSPHGSSRAWLAQDPRVEVVTRYGLPAEGLADAVKQAWAVGLSDLAKGAIDAQVWLREDVCVDDFLLADRLQEGFHLTSHEGLAMVDAREQGVLLATRKASLSTGVNLAHAASRVAGCSLVPGLALSLRPPGFPGPTEFLWRQAHRPCRPLLVVTASRVPPSEFYAGTYLGRSVMRLRQAGMELRVLAACQNERSLGAVYNDAIRPEYAGFNIVFVHDDVEINDGLWAQHIDEGLSVFDLVGLAGNVRRKRGQPAWHFPRQVGEWDQPDQLRGSVGHDTTGRTTPGRRVRGVSHYGPTRGPVEVLDGVLLAARVDTLLASGLRFDESLGFHFYDLDMCRSALIQGLRLGVWPIAVTHMSSGGYRSASWEAAYARYLAKWSESRPFESH